MCSIKKKKKKAVQCKWHETFIQTTNTQALVSIQEGQRMFWDTCETDRRQERTKIEDCDQSRFSP